MPATVLKGSMDNPPRSDFRVDYYEENDRDPGQWAKASSIASTTTYARSVSVPGIWFLVNHIPKTIIRTPDADRDEHYIVQLPMRCMWAGSPHI